jgi:competence protein ComEC
VAPPRPPRRLAEVEGRIVTVPERLGDLVRFELAATDGSRLDAFAPPAPWPLALGDRIRMRAHLRPPPPRRNPGGRDAAGRLAAAGIALQAFAAGPPVRVAAPSPLAYLERARERFAAAAGAALPPREAALVRAIATGDRSALDPETTASFARSGLAHILAVSGLHLVVVAFGLERALRGLLLRIEAVASRVDPRRAAAAALLPATAVDALATGAGCRSCAPPDRRGSRGSRRAARARGGRRERARAGRAPPPRRGPGGGPRPSPSSPSRRWRDRALGRAAPPADPLRRHARRARLDAGALLAALRHLAASLATAPVLAVHFRQVRSSGSSRTSRSGRLGAHRGRHRRGRGGRRVPPLAALLVACRPLAAALLALSDAAAAPPWGVLALASPGLAAVTGFAGAALAAGRLRGPPARVAAAAAAAACLLLPGPLRAAAARARGGLEVWFLSVGQGDAALLRLPDGSAVLVDGGGAPDGGADPGARDVVPLLRDLGVERLAAIFVSHPHPITSPASPR